MVARGQEITEKMAYMDKKKRFITNDHSNKFLKNLLPMKTESIQRKFYKVSDQNIYKGNYLYKLWNLTAVRGLEMSRNLTTATKKLN